MHRKIKETKRGDSKSPLLLSALELKEHIAQLANQYLPNDTYYLVDVVIKGSESRKKILVLVDGDKGINIDTCATISRQLGHHLEENEVMTQAYTLEVSSPGIDHPLSMLRQYQGRVGKRLKVTLTNGQQVSGQLLEVTPKAITLNKEVTKGKKIEQQTIEISFNEIEKSFVLISFK